MSENENTANYYAICNNLKTIIKTSWKDWSIQREEVENIAEHIFSIQMHAIRTILKSECQIDIMKVIMMITINKIGKIYSADSQNSKEAKMRIECETVSKVLKGLVGQKQISDLILEFDEGKTEEAKMFYYCDENYNDKYSIDLNKHCNIVNSYIKSSEAWLDYGQKPYNHDHNFIGDSKYLLKHQISNFDKKI